MPQGTEATTVGRPPIWSRRWARLAHIIRLNPLGMIGGVIVVIVGLAAVFADIVATHDPLAVDVTALLESPSFTHFSGTDDFGRDVFSRVVFGARISFLIGILAAVLGATTGALIGVVSAYYGGRFDMIVQRVVDIFMSIPSLILALVIASTMGHDFLAVGDISFGLILAIAIPQAPRVSRTMRATALGIKANMYIDAARSIGASNARIIGRHMLPNVASPYLVLLTASLGGAILVEAALSFLGLGVPEPAPSWGRMITGADAFRIETYPWVIVTPGLVLSLLVFGFNLFGDALRDILDPKMRRV